MKNRFYAIMILIVLLSVGLAACSASRSDGKCDSSFAAPGSFKNECRFGASEKLDNADLKLETSLASGSITFTLADPTGTTVWIVTSEAGSPLNQTKQFPDPAPGTWTLSIETHESQGSYSATWNGR